MEPADVNAPSPSRDDDAHLAELVRNSAPVLPDDDFSARVLAALPSKSAAASAPWRRTIVCAAGASAGCLVVLWCGPSWAEAADWLNRNATAGLSLDVSSLSIALTATAISLGFVFRAELRERLLS